MEKFYKDLYYEAISPIPKNKAFFAICELSHNNNKTNKEIYNDLLKQNIEFPKDFNVIFNKAGKIISY